MLLTQILSQLPQPLLLVGILFIATLLVLLVFISACSAGAARRILRLLEALEHLIHGTCPSCGREIKVSRRQVRRSRRG